MEIKYKLLWFRLFDNHFKHERSEFDLFYEIARKVFYAVEFSKCLKCVGSVTGVATSTL